MIQFIQLFDAQYFENMCRFALVGGMLYAIVRLFILLLRKKQGHEIHWGREILLFLFFVGGITLTVQLLLPILLPRRPWNFVPLRTIREYLAPYNGQPVGAKAWDWYRTAYFWGYLLMYVPFGCLIPALWKKCRSFVKTVSLLTGWIVLLECVQHFLGHVGDIDDVILGVISAALGYGVFWLAWNIKRSTRRH